MIIKKATNDYKIIVEQEHQTVAAHYEVEPKPAEVYIGHGYLTQWNAGFIDNEERKP